MYVSAFSQNFSFDIDLERSEMVKRQEWNMF